MATARYWRLRVLANWGAGPDVTWFGDIEFRSSAGGPDLTGGAGNPIASAAYNGSAYPLTQAFDGTTATAFGSNGVSGWVGWDFGSGNAHEVLEVVLRNPDPGYAIGYAIKDCLIEYSDDGAAWITYGSVTGNPQTYSSTTVFAITPPSSGVVAAVSPVVVLGGFGGASFSRSSAAATLFGYGGGRASISVASSVQINAGASAQLSMPMAKAFLLGHDSTGENGAAVILPTYKAGGFFGAVAAASVRPSASIQATFSGSGTASVSLPRPLVSALGTVPAVGRAAVSMSVAKAIGYGGAVLSVSIHGATVAATATSGGVGRIAATLPLFDVVGTGTSKGVGRASVIAPKPFMVNGGVAYLLMPSAQLVAVGSAVAAVTYEAYALNLKHNAETTDELTRYTNFPFDRIVRYENSYYGMNSTGLYLLEGDTDFAEPAPTPISWSWKTTMTDFGTTQLQTVRWAYFGGRMAPAAQIAIHFGDTASESYAYNTPRDTSAQNYRQEFGRGIKSRYYAFSGQGSGELSLDSINFIIAKSARKV